MRKMYADSEIKQSGFKSGLVTRLVSGPYHKILVSKWTVTQNRVNHSHTGTSGSNKSHHFILFLVRFFVPLREIWVTLPGYSTAAARAALPIPNGECCIFVCPNNLDFQCMHRC